MKYTYTFVDNREVERGGGIEGSGGGTVHLLPRIKGEIRRMGRS
jgi:hypothetical protein